MDATWVLLDSQQPSMPGGLEGLFSVIAPGTSVGAVIVVVVLFLRHVRAAEADRKTENERCEETIRAIVKEQSAALAELSASNRDSFTTITDRLDRMIERLKP